MSENIHESIHDVAVEVHLPDDYKNEATIETFAYPDGSTRANGLGPDELREVADVINDVAGRMED